MPIGAVRLSLKRSESRCKQWAVIEDVDKGSYGETRMKKVNKEDSKENGGEKLETGSRHYFWEEFWCKWRECNSLRVRIDNT